MLLGEEISVQEHFTYQLALAAPTEGELAELEFPLSPAQGFVFGSEDFPAHRSILARFNVQILLDLSGPLDLSRLQRAIRAVVNRHPALQTRFHSHNGRFFQKFLDQPAPLEVIDVTETNSVNDISSILERLSATKFKLLGGVLHRFILLRHSDSHHVLQIVLNHLITDGKSTGVLRRDLIEAYGADRLNEASVNLDYPAFLQWADADSGRATFEQAGEAWKQVLSITNLSQSAFPQYASANSTVRLFTNSRLRLAAEQPNMDAVRRVALQLRVAPATVILSAFLLLSVADALHERPIVVEASVIDEGRWYKDLAQVCGWFAQPVPLAVGVKPDDEIRTLLKTVHEAVLQNRMRPLRQGSVNDLFPTGHKGAVGKGRIAFNLLPSTGAPSTAGGLTVRRLEAGLNVELPFSLVLSLRMGQSSYELEWWANSQEFDQRALRAISRQMFMLVHTLATSPEETVRNVLKPLLRHDSAYQTEVGGVSER